MQLRVSTPTHRPSKKTLPAKRETVCSISQCAFDSGRASHAALPIRCFPLQRSAPGLSAEDYSRPSAYVALPPEKRLEWNHGLLRRPRPASPTPAHTFPLLLLDALCSRVCPAPIGTPHAAAPM